MENTTPLDDLLRLWALYCMPDLLADGDLFDSLSTFIQALLSDTVAKEREATTRRLLRSSRS